MANFNIGDLTRTHGLSKTPEYKIWEAMKRRCDNPADSGYHRYGGRGIGYAPEWAAFEAFYADMGKRPSKDHTLERIDNDAGYSPKNCRWATRRAQANNRRTNNLLTLRGETLTVAQWTRRTGLPRTIIRGRLRRGWSVAETLTTPPLPTGYSREQYDRLIAKGLLPK